MRYILFLISILAVGQSVFPPPTKPSCTATRTTDCSVTADSTGAVSVGATVLRRICDGTTDMTAALQSDINSVQTTKGRLIISGRCKITDTLTISDAMTLAGEGVQAVHGSMDVANARNDVPTISPYLTGSVLLMTTAAKDPIKITASGKSVHLRDFGILFDPSIAFVNTGHGVNSQAANAASGLPDWGVSECEWKNVYVWGHDGNHYGFRLVNEQLVAGYNLRAWGGGVLELATNSNVGTPGNTVWVQPYGAMFAGGTAHGYYVHREGGAAAGNVLNTFIRPQVNVLAVPTAFSAWSIPAVNVDVQKIANFETITSEQLTLLAPDFESAIGGATVLPGSATPGYWNCGGLQSDCKMPRMGLASNGLTIYNPTTGIKLAGLLPESGETHHDGDGPHRIRDINGVERWSIYTSGGQATGILPADGGAGTTYNRPWNDVGLIGSWSFYGYQNPLAIADRSGHGWTASAGPTTQAPPLSGTVATFTAASYTHFALPTNHVPFSTFTYIARLTPSGSGNRAILGAAASFTPEWRLDATGKQELLNRGTASIGTSTSAVSGTKTIAVSYDAVSGACKFYLDGVPDGTATSAQALTNGAAVIGGASTAASASGTEYFSGTMAGVLIYGRVLSDAEVAARSADLAAAQ